MKVTRACLAIICFALLIFYQPTASADQIDSQRWKVEVSVTHDITGPDSICKKVTNNGNADIFVPIKTTAEWQGFLSNLPSGVTVADCAFCGDGACNGAENCSSCPADCGSCAYCGDGSCNGGETCSTCPGDCGICPTTCGAWGNWYDGHCTGNLIYGPVGSPGYDACRPICESVAARCVYSDPSANCSCYDGTKVPGDPAMALSAHCD